MRVSPIVQPINTTILLNQIENSGLHCTHRCATQSITFKYFQIKKKTQGYNALMGVPPKVQPIIALILANNIKKVLGYTALIGVPSKVQPINATIVANHMEKSRLDYTHGCSKVQPVNTTILEKEQKN